MKISSIVVPRNWNPVRPPAAAKSAFTLSLAARTAAMTKSTHATGGTATTAAPDFENMTPLQLYDAAESMYRQGKISPQNLVRLQMLAGGLDRDAPAYANKNPVNYVDVVNNQVDDIVGRGGKGSATYNSYVAILHAMGKS